MRSRPARRALMLLSTALVCVAVATPAVAAPAKPRPKPPAVKVYPGDPKAASCPAPKVMSKRDVVYGQDPVRKMVALTFTTPRPALDPAGPEHPEAAQGQGDLLRHRRERRPLPRPHGPHPP